jgi:AcrR family transcriptional regulator
MVATQTARTAAKKTPSAVRLTAAARREVLVEVARRHFAERGLYGTPTLAIAEEAGISQAYLFRLYPTKQELFAASVEACIAKARDAFEAGAASRVTSESVLEAIGRGYTELLQSDPTVLTGQLHANAAAAREPVIRKAMRNGWESLYETVERLSGASPEEIRGLFAEGMLINVAAAVGFADVNKPWAKVLGAKENC